MLKGTNKSRISWLLALRALMPLQVSMPSSYVLPKNDYKNINHDEDINPVLSSYDDENLLSLLDNDRMASARQRAKRQHFIKFCQDTVQDDLVLLYNELNEWNKKVIQEKKQDQINNSANSSKVIHTKGYKRLQWAIGIYNQYIKTGAEKDVGVPPKMVQDMKCLIDTNHIVENYKIQFMKMYQKSQDISCQRLNILKNEQDLKDKNEQIYQQEIMEIQLDYKVKQIATILKLLKIEQTICKVDHQQYLNFINQQIQHFTYSQMIKRPQYQAKTLDYLYQIKQQVEHQQEDLKSSYQQILLKIKQQEINDREDKKVAEKDKKVVEEDKKVAEEDRKVVERQKVVKSEEDRKVDKKVVEEDRKVDKKVVEEDRKVDKKVDKEETEQVKEDDQESKTVQLPTQKANENDSFIYINDINTSVYVYVYQNGHWLINELKANEIIEQLKSYVLQHEHKEKERLEKYQKELNKINQQQAIKIKKHKAQQDQKDNLMELKFIKLLKDNDQLALEQKNTAELEFLSTDSVTTSIDQTLSQGIFDDLQSVVYERIRYDIYPRYIQQYDVKETESKYYLMDNVSLDELINALIEIPNDLDFRRAFYYFIKCLLLIKIY